MATTPPEGEPYQSALDLPSFREMLEQIQGAKLLTRFIAREQRKDFVNLEQQVRQMASTVDDFYERIGARNWVFHDSLDVTVIRAMLDTTETPEATEQAFIAMYQGTDTLQNMARLLRAFEGLRVRTHLIDLARADYEAERWAACTLMLLTVMDGFVNDVESQRRGLHARDADDMNAWDSVAGHHLGLGNAHRSFTKTIKKTTDAECFELHRHGIVHGTILNYDNVFVATKAWNRLFAVADWAKSLDKAKVVPKPDPSWSEVLGQVAENERVKKALAEWQPSSLVETDPGFADDPAYLRAADYLDGWQKKNYGGMATFLGRLVAADTPQKTAGRVREQYEFDELSSFVIRRLDHRAAAVCVIDADLTINGESKQGRMRWIKEQTNGDPAAPGQEGDWKIMSWGPHAMVNFDPES